MNSNMHNNKKDIFFMKQERPFPLVSITVTPVVIQFEYIFTFCVLCVFCIKKYWKFVEKISQSYPR